MKDLYESLHEAHELDEETASVRVPAGIRDYVDAYCNAINDMKGYNENLWDRGTGGMFFMYSKPSSAYADRVMRAVGENYSLTKEQIRAVYEYVEFQDPADWYDDPSVKNEFVSLELNKSSEQFNTYKQYLSNLCRELKKYQIVMFRKNNVGTAQQDSITAVVECQKGSYVPLLTIKLDSAYGKKLEGQKLTFDVSKDADTISKLMLKHVNTHKAFWSSYDEFIKQITNVVNSTQYMRLEECSTKRKLKIEYSDGREENYHLSINPELLVICPNVDNDVAGATVYFITPEKSSFNFGPYEFSASMWSSNKKESNYECSELNSAIQDIKNFLTSYDTPTNQWEGISQNESIKKLNKVDSDDTMEALNIAHQLDEGTTNVRVPLAIRDYVDAYCDAINDMSSYDEDKWDRGTGGEFFDAGKCSSAYADRVMYGVMDNYELNDNQLDAVYKYVEFQQDAEWYDDSSVTNVFDVACLQDEETDEDVEDYDDEFEEGLIGTAIQAAKNLNPLNLFEGEGADTTRAIVDILDKTSTEDKPTWVKAVKDVVDVIPDEYMDNLFDIAKEKLSDVQVSEEDKTKIVDAAGVPVEGAQEANTVGKILSLFDITEWDPKTLKTYIVSVLAIVALIEPTPILEIITGVITLLPPEAVKAILTVTNMIGNPVGAAATLVNRAMKSRGNDDLEESFNVGDRVKQTWANPYNVGEVIDTKYDPEKGNLVQVKWDYSDGPEIEWLNYEDVSPYNEEDEKAGYYEGLFDKPKKNRHTDENGNPVLTKLDPPPEGFFDDEAPKLYKAEPAKHKRRHSIFGNKKTPTSAGDPLDDLFDDEF